jgi:ribonuclease P protein component
MSRPAKTGILHNHRQFRQVYDLGDRFHTPYFSVFILKNDRGERRCGITVTRKIGSAVVRNRCKRILREVVRSYYTRDLASNKVKEIAEASNAAGYDLVINVKTGLLTADFKQIGESFARVMDRFHKSLL